MTGELLPVLLENVGRFDAWLVLGIIALRSPQILRALLEGIRDIILALRTPRNRLVQEIAQIEPSSGRQKK